MKKKIAIFISGTGTNCINIIHHFENHPTIQAFKVVSNKPHLFAYKEQIKIPCCTINNEQLKDENRMTQILQDVDFIVLAGFLLKVPEYILLKYPNRIINIHPALLPKYGGKGMYGDKVHKAVKMNKEKISGITIHQVNREYDKGLCLAQFTTVIDASDSPHDIAQKVHQLEYAHYPEIIERTIYKEFNLK